MLGLEKTTPLQLECWELLAYMVDSTAYGADEKEYLHNTKQMEKNLKIGFNTQASLI
jgi:hypothetical protein